MKKLIDLVEISIPVGVWDDYDEKWITDQKHSDLYYGGLPVKFSISTNIVYHGTNNVDSIKKYGLTAGSYVTLDINKASMYGRYILKIILPKTTKLSFGEDEAEFITIKDIPPKYIKSINNKK